MQLPATPSNCCQAQDDSKRARCEMPSLDAAKLRTAVAASALWTKSPCRQVVHKVNKRQGHIAVLVLVVRYVHEVITCCWSSGIDGLEGYV